MAHSLSDLRRKRRLPDHHRPAAGTSDRSTNGCGDSTAPRRTASAVVAKGTHSPAARSALQRRRSVRSVPAQTGRFHSWAGRQREALAEGSALAHPDADPRPIAVRCLTTSVDPLLQGTRRALQVRTRGRRRPRAGRLDRREGRLPAHQEHGTKGAAGQDAAKAQREKDQAGVFPYGKFVNRQITAIQDNSGSAQIAACFLGE